MKGMLAVLGRELTEWRLLFLVALVAGLIPLAVPWLPHPGGLEPAEMRDGTALGLSLIASAVLALVLGASVLARDLSERRLGFYFARPLSGAAIWAGKMLGAAILAVGTGVLVLLPTLLVGGNIAPAGRFGVSETAIDNLAACLQLVLGALLLLVTAHAVSVMVRSRSPWLALDLAALAVVAAVLWSCRRVLRSETAYLASNLVQIAFVGAVLVAAAVAGLVQVVRGRTDLRRGHRLLSLTLWSLLGAAAIGSTGYTRWVLGATPRDLVELVSVLPAPSGNWIAVSGEAAGRLGYTPSFLLDLASGRFVKIDGTLQSFMFSPLVYSEDGSRAVWLSRSSGEESALSFLDLRRPGAVPVRTSIFYRRTLRSLTLSPDGHRVAARWNDRLTVDDLQTGRLLVSTSLPFPFEREFGERLRFSDSGHLQIFQSSEIEERGQPPVWRLTRLDLDIATRRITPGAKLDIPGRKGDFQLSPDGTHALLWSPAELRLADLRTGRIMPLPAPKDAFAIKFFADGRFTVAGKDRDRLLLYHFSPDGTELLRVPLPGSRILIGGQPAPGLLAVATSDSASYQDRKAWTSRLIDLRTGQVRLLERGLLPTTMGPREPGSLPSRMFHRGHGDLLLLDPATGQLRTVLPGRDRASGRLDPPWLLPVQIYRP
jgi:hypothetical protein